MRFEPDVFYRELGQGPKRTNLAFTL